MQSLPQPELVPWQRRAVVVSALLAALAVLWWQVAHQWPYISDDAFISLRYSERLIDGRGLTWNDGEYVEGYTNLLWVLGCSALLAVGLDGVATLRVLGAVCAAGALVVVAATLRPRFARDVVGCFGAPLLVAASGPMVVWTCGGLEGPMVLLFTSWSAMAAIRVSAPVAMPRSWFVLAGAPMALLCLTRSDAPLWVATTLAALFTVRAASLGTGAAWRSVVALGLLPALAVVGQFAFRLLYYGDLLPNTAYAKAGMTWTSIAAGLRYVGDACFVLRGLLALALLGLLLSLRAKARRGTALVLAAPAALFLLYLIAIGGDHFPGYRMLLMVVGPLALLAGLGLRLCAAWRPPSFRPAGILLAIGLALGAVTLQVRDGREDWRIASAHEEVWEWEAKELAELLGRAFGDRDMLLAVDGAGVMPYFSRLRCLDMLGLCDRHIARRGPRVDLFGDQFVPGHMLGDGDYVLSQEPDLVQFNAPGTWLAGWSSAVELDRDPGFRSAYRCVRVDLQAPLPPDWQPRKVHSFLWVRVRGKVGVEEGGGRVTVPAWIMSGLRARSSLREEYEGLKLRQGELTPESGRVFRWMQQKTVAVPNATGDGFVLSLTDGAPAQLEELDLPAGAWRARVVPADAEVEVELLSAGDDAAVARRAGAGERGAGERGAREGEAWDWKGGAVTLRVSVRPGAASPQLVERVELQAQ